MWRSWQALQTLPDRWRARWQARRESAALERRAIPDGLWRRTLKRFPFLPSAGMAEEQTLRRLCSLFLDRKEFSGAHGLRVTDDMAVAIAAQACLPVLHRGLSLYDSFVGIVVQPGPVRTRRSEIDDDGIVHEFDDELSGEAVAGGPVMLSWRDVRSAGAKATQGYNVVIHEFAHVLDLTDGLPNGMPLLPPDLSRSEWESVLSAEFHAFCERVDPMAQEAPPARPRPLVATSEDSAQTRYGEDEGDLALDPYGATAIDEFFAVASEAFFVSPRAMHAQHPALYELFTRYYLQDPEQRQMPARLPSSTR